MNFKIWSDAPKPEDVVDDDMLLAIRSLIVCAIQGKHKIGNTITIETTRGREIGLVFDE